MAKNWPTLYMWQQSLAMKQANFLNPGETTCHFEAVLEIEAQKFSKAKITMFTWPRFCQVSDQNFYLNGSTHFAKVKT